MLIFMINQIILSIIQVAFTNVWLLLTFYRLAFNLSRIFFLSIPAA